jgi:hypothetical protein
LFATNDGTHGQQLFGTAESVGSDGPGRGLFRENSVGMRRTTLGSSSREGSGVSSSSLSNGLASPVAAVIEGNPNGLPLNEIDGSGAERRFCTSNPITDSKCCHPKTFFYALLGNTVESYTYAVEREMLSTLGRCHI